MYLMTHLMVHLKNDLMKLQRCLGIASSVLGVETMVGWSSSSTQLWTASQTALPEPHSLLLASHLICPGMHQQCPTLPVAATVAENVPWTVMY